MVKKLNIALAVVLFGAILTVGFYFFSTKAVPSLNKAPVKSDKLAVLWTSGDPDVAHKVCFMYTHNAKKQGWFKEVKLIVWGPSSRLLATDKAIQAEVKKMQKDKVVVQACQACADSYGVSGILRKLGIEVKYMGQPLTQILKTDDYEVLTF